MAKFLGVHHSAIALLRSGSYAWPAASPRIYIAAWKAFQGRVCLGALFEELAPYCKAHNHARDHERPDPPESSS